MYIVYRNLELLFYHPQVSYVFGIFLNRKYYINTSYILDSIQHLKNYEYNIMDVNKTIYMYLFHQYLTLDNAAVLQMGAFSRVWCISFTLNP